MRFFNDLQKIMASDNKHIMQIKISFEGLLVKLFYDPKKELDERYMLPIYYDAAESFSYIPVDVLKQEYNGDYGFELDEINLTNKIMECMENNKDELSRLCSICDFDCRNKKYQNMNDKE